MNTQEMLNRKREVREWIQSETCPVCKWKGGIDWVCDSWFCKNCGYKMDLVSYDKRIVGVWDRRINQFIYANKENEVQKNGTEN